VLRLRCTYNSRGGSRGVTRVTSHPPLTRQPVSCYYYACDLSYFDVVLCPSSSQIPQCLLSSLARVPKVTPPLKNPRSANVLCYYLCCFNLTVFWPASDAYCLLEVYKVLTAKIDEYKIPLYLRSEDADYSSCVAKTKLEKKQDRISKKCDMPLTEVMTLICVHTAYVHRESKKKQDTQLLAITSLTIIRFSNFFH